jgi:tetratricopeptide (TPR) repeat protein
VAYDLINLASVLRRSGRPAEAKAVYRDALAVARSVFGPAHPQLARTINNLAVVLRDEGDVAGAEPLMREALAMSRKLYGAEHPDIALQLSNLAALVGARDHDGGSPWRGKRSRCAASSSVGSRAGGDEPQQPRDAWAESLSAARPLSTRRSASSGRSSGTSTRAMPSC